MDAGEIPTWLNWAATFVIIVIVGVAGRLGWSKAGKTQPNEEAEVVGAVVDVRAVKALAETVEFALDRVTNLHDERIRHDKQNLDEIGYLRKEIRDLVSALKNFAVKEQ